jgi:hypothetical protein
MEGRGESGLGVNNKIESEVLGRKAYLSLRKEELREIERE